MQALLPLPVAIPLITAAALVMVEHVAPRRVVNAIAILAAAAATGISIAIMLASQHRPLLQWFGGWKPRQGAAIGVSFVADPLGAGMAALVCGLVLLSLVYSFTYMREAARLFDVLMLVFCGALAGFALTGDIFNMFVWFELMSVAAYALAGFAIEELGPIQGAINFGISNTFGVYLLLLGIGLLYARTGALNLAQIGQALAGHRPDGVVIVSLTLVGVGFLVKSAAVPFHFWHADAHAVAPMPVAVIYSGAMVQLGLLAIARLYWTVFAAPIGDHAADFRAVIVWLGVVTALVGAVMCFLQRHLKRMLAFSTICHSGVVLIGIGLLDRKALAGAANVVLAHGLLKAGLFFTCGLLLLRLREVDELRLHGKGRGLPLTGVLWALGAVGLIGLPYVGIFLGHSLVDDGASTAGARWIEPIIMVAAGISCGALLRAGARVFLGWGPKEDDLLSPEPAEGPVDRHAAMPLMAAVAALTIGLGLVAAVIPGLQQRSEHGADELMDRGAYAAQVLKGVPRPASPHLPFALEAATVPSWAYGIGAFLVALAAAAFGLWRVRLPRGIYRSGARALGPPISLLRAAHSGIVGDYLLWIVFGTTLIGGVWAITLR